MADDNPDIRAQADRYRYTVARSGRSHYKAAEMAEAKNKYLGVPTAVLGAVVGTAIFGTIRSNPALGWKIAAGLISIAASTLATMQTFFNYSSAAANHRNAGAAYGALRRQFDAFMLQLPTSDRAKLVTELDRLRNEIDRLGKDAPLIPSKAYVTAKRELGETDRLASTVSGQMPDANLEF